MFICCQLGHLCDLMLAGVAALFHLMGSHLGRQCTGWSTWTFWSCKYRNKRWKQVQVSWQVLHLLFHVCFASIRCTFHCREFAGGMGNSGKVSFKVNSLATVQNCLVIFVSCIDSVVESYLTIIGIHWKQSPFGMKLFFVWCSNGFQNTALCWESCPCLGTCLGIMAKPRHMDCCGRDPSYSSVGHVLDHGSTWPSWFGLEPPCVAGKNSTLVV